MVSFLFIRTDSKTASSMVHQTNGSHSNSQNPGQPSQNHPTHHLDKSTADRPYLGQTSLLPTTSTSSIKSEPGYEYGCIQNQTPSYPYQQLFGFPGSTTSGSEIAYHHQHHVTAAAKLMASS